MSVLLLKRLKNGSNGAARKNTADRKVFHAESRLRNIDQFYFGYCKKKTVLTSRLKLLLHFSLLYETVMQRKKRELAACGFACNNICDSSKCTRKSVLKMVFDEWR